MRSFRLSVVKKIKSGTTCNMVNCEQTCSGRWGGHTRRHQAMTWVGIMTTRNRHPSCGAWEGEAWSIPNRMNNTYPHWAGSMLEEWREGRCGWRTVNQRSRKGLGGRGGEEERAQDSAGLLILFCRSQGTTGEKWFSAEEQYLLKFFLNACLFIFCWAGPSMLHTGFL